MLLSVFAHCFPRGGPRVLYPCSKQGRRRVSLRSLGDHAAMPRVHTTSPILAVACHITRGMAKAIRLRPLCRLHWLDVAGNGRPGVLRQRCSQCPRGLRPQSCRAFLNRPGRPAIWTMCTGRCRRGWARHGRDRGSQDWGGCGGLRAPVTVVGMPPMAVTLARGHGRGRVLHVVVSRPAQHE